MTASPTLRIESQGEVTMAAREIVDTFYGKHSKYEVVRVPGGVFDKTKYYVYKDGKHHRGSFGSLRDAAEAARDEAEKR